MKSLFKKKKYGKWEDVSVITSGGKWYLLQVRECELTGEKQFHQRNLGWVNDKSILQEVKSKLEL